MKEKEIYSFLYMLYELKQGIPLYDLQHDFLDNLESAKVGYINDKGTEHEGTLYNVINYDHSSIDVSIIGVLDSDRNFANVPKIELCNSFDIYSLPSTRSSTKDLVGRIHYLKAMVAYFDEHAEDVRILRLFEDNDTIVTNIATKSNFKLSDIQPLLDLISR